MHMTAAARLHSLRDNATSGSEVDAQPRFDELLSAQTTRMHDLHPLHDILQHALLACNIEQQSQARNGFGAITVTVDNCTGEHRWPACEGIEIASMRSSTAQIHFLVGRLG